MNQTEPKREAPHSAAISRTRATFSGGRPMTTDVIVPDAAANARGVSRRARGGRGAALVEFAIIMPVLFLLLFGIIEFGTAFNDYQSVRQGVREGARQAVVKNYGTNPGTCTLVGASATGAPLEVKRVMCLAKDRIGIDPTARISVRYTASDGTSQDKGSVKVCAQRNVRPFTGFIPGIDGIALKSKIEMRMEQAIGAGITAATNYEETAPAGGSWSWC